MGKQILILAGPNGAGKTTFAREFLVTEANCPTFLNADIIAAELSPQHPEQVSMRAARFMLQRIRGEVTEGEIFAFETTLANRSYAHSIREWQAAGYHMALWFLALPSAEAAIARVAQRVLQCGHNIPEEVVRRRFVAGRANFDNIYRGLVDAWVLYDNSETVPVLLDWGEKR
ncbi:MAG TPA: zeta toxin family protein [Polyangiaceae bacterium]|jgi:predicted ABC-type ATPase|nr:zeta toxin family protein [Polyangiaceae bacterium]